MRRAAVGAVLVLALVLGPAQPAEAGNGRGLVGAHVHSAWLAPGSPVTPAQLVGLARDVGAQVVPFGVPIATPEARAAAPAIAADFLARLGGIKAIPQINTFALPAEQQTEAGIRALFRELAPVLKGANVLAVAGANEPLTKGKAWPSADAAEARVRLEYRLWHEVSGVPFCHKFTPPNINVAGMGWDRMERLWATGQDAVCYDWYEGNKDTLSNITKLRKAGQRFHQPVHILETAIPGQAVATLTWMADRAASVSVYELLARAGGADEKFGAFLLDGATFRSTAVARMLRSYAP